MAGRLLSRAVSTAERLVPLSAAGHVALRHRLSSAWWLTFALLFAWAVVLHRLAVPDLPLRLAGVLCGGEIALTIPYRRWFRTGRALGLMLLTGFLVDTTGAAIFFAGADLTPVAHLILLMAIVPAFLCSPRTGGVVLAAAIAVHLALVAGSRLAVTPLEVVVPLMLYVLTGFQCLQYGRVLATQTQHASDESRMSAALLRVTGELAAASSAASVLQRLTELACEISGSDYAAVLLRDPERGCYRVMAVTAEGKAPEEFRTLELTAEDLQLARLVESAGMVAASPAEAGLPHWAILRWWQGSLVAAALVRGDEPVGVLTAGHVAPGPTFGPLARRLLVGMARAGVLALENARLVEDLRAASALKSEFIGTISHEFRSPLHAIVGYVDILRSEADAAPIADVGLGPRGVLDRVYAHALQLLETIEATLTVSRLEAGRLPVHAARIGIEGFFARLADELPEAWSKPGVRLIWDVSRGLPDVTTDAAKLKIVLRNLIHNALKFTDRGHVRIGAIVDGDGTVEAPARLHVVVEDTGIGIPPDMLHVVFEMFRQADGSDRRRHGGVGLGLYIAKRFVEAQGGTIAVASVPGRGSRFDLALPVELAADGPAALSA